jgi:hypothetical protein
MIIDLNLNDYRSFQKPKFEGTLLVNALQGVGRAQAEWEEMGTDEDEDEVEAADEPERGQATDMEGVEDNVNKSRFHQVDYLAEQLQNILHLLQPDEAAREEAEANAKREEVAQVI